MDTDSSTNQSDICFRPSPTGGGTRLEAAQFLAERSELIFAYFSDAYQLENLTPPWLQFSVRTQPPIRTQSGTLINYRLRLHGLSIYWQSRIEVWEPPRRFVDVQIRGPYRRWRHEHVFCEVAGGTLCRDVVDYVTPGGWLVDRFFVRKDIEQIFEYRQRQLSKRFPQREVRSKEPLDSAASNLLHVDA